MTRNARTQRERYRRDTEYADTMRTRAKSYRDRWKRDPLFRRLENSTKAVHRLRESYHARLKHAERLFNQLQDAIKEREECKALWRESKQSRRLAA